MEKVRNIIKKDCNSSRLIRRAMGMSIRRPRLRLRGWLRPPVGWLVGWLGRAVGVWRVRRELGWAGLGAEEVAVVSVCESVLEIRKQIGYFLAAISIRASLSAAYPLADRSECEKRGGPAAKRSRRGTRPRAACPASNSANRARFPWFVVVQIPELHVVGDLSRTAPVHRACNVGGWMQRMRGSPVR